MSMSNKKESDEIRRILYDVTRIAINELFPGKFAYFNKDWWIFDSYIVELQNIGFTQRIASKLEGERG